MYISRFIEDKILSVGEAFKVIYIGGPRQVGKTTTLLKLAKQKNFNYVTLDDLEIRDLAKNDPKLFIKQFKPPLLIDEIQYAPEIIPYIKIAVDQTNLPNQYWLTGSEHFNIIKNLQESLAGRVAILSLNTLSLWESLQKEKNPEPFLPTTENQTYSEEDIYEKILRGGFPFLISNPNLEADIFFSSYIQTYIEKDLVNIFGIQNTTRFYKFLQLCADRSGQVLNYSDLSRDADISVSTAKDWIGILEGTMQIYLLQPFSNNFSKRLIKSPKMYFMDCGLLSYLAGWKKISSLVSSVYAGKLFENFVVSEIVKSYLYRGKKPPLFYFRDKQAREIDLIIENENRLYPIEIKSSSMFKTDFIKGINYLKNNLSNVNFGTVILNSQKTFQPLEEIRAISVLAIN